MTASPAPRRADVVAARRLAIERLLYLVVTFRLLAIVAFSSLYQSFFGRATPCTRRSDF